LKSNIFGLKHRYIMAIANVDLVERRLKKLQDIADMDTETVSRFRRELGKGNFSEVTFQRIIRTLEITSPKGFIKAFQFRLAKGTYSVPDVANRSLEMAKYLNKIEAIRPVVERMARNALAHGLTARLESHPVYMDDKFPTLVFRNGTEWLFSATFEPKGETIEVHHIQGANCENSQGIKDEAKLAEIRNAMRSLDFADLRVGMFDLISTAAKGLFKRVYILRPTKKHDFGPEGIFFGLAKRASLRRTNTRASRDLVTAQRKARTTKRPV
jgi:hypothetical protein